MLNEDDLRAKLKRSAETGKPLRVKLGMDPTAPDVTLGHCVPLKVIRQFQEWGHKAVLIIGDYTARVGDPTGRNKTRPQLSGEEIDSNAKTYIAQVGKVLLTGPQHLEVRYNGEWLGKMGMVDIIRLASRATVAQMLTREDFAKRYAEGTEIRLHEIMYPLLQGWDSVQIDADVEMGGSDQLFNNMVGRGFQQEEGNDGQVVIVTPLLVGTDGVKKMSKSVGNYIAVTDPPGGQKGIFGKVMSLPDEAVPQWWRLCLGDEPPSGEKMASKLALAAGIVAKWKGPDAAAAAELHFTRVVRRHEAPEEVPEEALPEGDPIHLPALLTNGMGISSTSEARRLIAQGGVKIDGEVVSELDVARERLAGAVVQAGKRRFMRFRAA